MTQRITRPETADEEQTEMPPPITADPRITMSRAEIEAYRAKLQALYHEP